MLGDKFTYAQYKAHREQTSPNGSVIWANGRKYRVTARMENAKIIDHRGKQYLVVDE